MYIYIYTYIAAKPTQLRMGYCVSCINGQFKYHRNKETQP